MKLIIAIAQERNKRRLFDRFTVEDIKFTVIHSTGGFLRQGNLTILICVDENRVDHVLNVIKDCCKTHDQMMGLPDDTITRATRPIGLQSFSVKTGGAVAFVVDVDRFESY